MQIIIRVTELINTLELCTTAICVQITNDMKCTIFSVLLLMGVFNVGWIEGFKYNANIYNLKKTTSPKNAQTTGKTVQNWELPVMHILYINLWTLLTSVAFLWIFLMFSWICLKLSFQRGGHTTIFEKIDYMPISLAGPWGPSGPWQIKKLCHKKKFCVEVFFIHNGHFWKMHKESEAFL